MTRKLIIQDPSVEKKYSFKLTLSNGDYVIFETFNEENILEIIQLIYTIPVVENNGINNYIKFISNKLKDLKQQNKIKIIGCISESFLNYLI